MKDTSCKCAVPKAECRGGTRVGTHRAAQHPTIHCLLQLNQAFVCVCCVCVCASLTTSTIVTDTTPSSIMKKLYAGSPWRMMTSPP